MGMQFLDYSHLRNVYLQNVQMMKWNKDIHME